MSRNPVILEDTFTVTGVNLDGRVYQRVSRVLCKNEDDTLTATMDFNTEEFPVAFDERLIVTVANSLELSGAADRKHYDHSIYHRETRLDDCDYAMHGRVYHHGVDEASLEVTVYISCGGLLTQIKGKPESLRDIHYNSDVYLLVKRVGN